MSGGSFFVYIFVMKFLSALCACSLVLLAGCAGSKGSVDGDAGAKAPSTECPENESFYGSGLAGSYQTALMLAQRGIASALDSAVKASTDTLGRIARDDELEKLSLVAQAQFLSRIENPENVGIDTVEENSGKFTVRACMARVNAAIPFRGKMAALRDSVGLLAAEVSAQEGPLEKHAAYKALRNVYARTLALQRILVALGAERDASPDSAYVKANREFSMYRAAYAFVFKKVAHESDTPQSERLYALAYARMAKDYPVRQATCGNALSVEMDVYPVTCDTSSFGMVCNAGITLKGSTCKGDSLFVLQSNVNAQGADEPEAMERLGTAVSEGVWYDEWRKDLNKWSLK